MTRVSVSRQPTGKSRRVVGTKTKEIDTSPPTVAKKKIRTISTSSPHLSYSEEEDSPLRPIFCLKKVVDLKRYEKTEDCFILDFDPSLTENPSSVADDDATDLSVIAEKGKVACRDYPHSRHLCVKFPFDTTKHEMFCELCYCYVCDSAAPCRDWMKPLTAHCHASDNIASWKELRKSKRHEQGQK